MPWEKAFDEDEVIAKAMNVFWMKGYEPASMADLISSTGITRGSLYNAFGGKEQLFVKSLLKYHQERRAFLAELEAMDDPKLAIAKFFSLVVSDAQTDCDKKGCFLINTAPELATHGEEVNKIVRNGLRELEAFFRRCVEVAQSRGAISKSIEASATAKTLLALLVALRVLGRNVYDKEALTTIADQALRLIEIQPSV